MKCAALILVSGVLFGCSSPPEQAANSQTTEKDLRIEKLDRQKDSIVRFYEPMKTRPGDWLESQNEPGETFREYIASNPTLPTAERRTIHIQPIGTFTPDQRKAIRLTADYMKAFYNLPVKLNADRQLGNVPADLKRESGYPKRTQIRTQYFLDSLLPKLLRADAAALIAFTNHDLYPGNTWAFVFGQASFQNRVGVWSLDRLDDLTGGDRNAFIDRTLKISVHEVGHMFSMKHCTKYECLMSGTNHLAETDRRPLDNCPECMAKLAWAMNYDPVERYRKLAAFWRKQSRQNEAERCNQMAEAADSVTKLPS